MKPERRYFELRHDRAAGERVLTGSAMRYGDVAELPWGERERFKPGAFGDLRNADVRLNVQHDRGRLLARTGGGGLTLRDNAAALEIWAELPKTREADDTLELVRTGVLRGLSIEFMPERTSMQGDITTVERADLLGVAVVDIPAYPAAEVAARQKEMEMDEDAIRKMIADAVKGGGKSHDGITESVSAAVREHVDAAFAARDKAEAERREAEDKAAKERSAAEQATVDAEQRAEERADLLLLTRDLLPDDYKARGKSDHDILVDAVGNEVPDAKDRSADYLRAKVEAIAERRAAKDEGSQKRKAPMRNIASDTSRPINMLTLRRAS